MTHEKALERFSGQFIGPDDMEKLGIHYWNGKIAGDLAIALTGLPNPDDFPDEFGNGNLFLLPPAFAMPEQLKSFLEKHEALFTKRAWSYIGKNRLWCRMLPGFALIGTPEEQIRMTVDKNVFEQIEALSSRLKSPYVRIPRLTTMLWILLIHRLAAGKHLVRPGTLLRCVSRVGMIPIRVGNGLETKIDLLGKASSIGIDKDGRIDIRRVRLDERADTLGTISIISRKKS